jgi:anti-sigma-K factor RskA
MNSHIEAHALVGAYALDALEGEEKAVFERHLEHCEACRDELAGFAETAARLATAQAMAPPAGLKASTMAEVGRTRQLSHRTIPLREDRAHHGRLPARRWRVAGVAAALALVLGVSVAVGLGLSSGDPRPDQMSHEIAAVLAAPDAEMINAHVRTGGMATVVMSKHDARLVFVARGLAQLDSSKCYELWLVGPARDREVGTLPSPNGSVTGPLLASDIQAGERLGLSVEPAVGSPRPTTRMLFLVTL